MISLFSFSTLNIIHSEFNTHIARCAYEFASYAHSLQDQRRKYTNQPYIVHPREVALILQDCKFDGDVVAAGLLHDVVEDTVFTNSDIINLFGHRIASLVEMVTDVSTKEDGNRKKRKEIDRLHTAKADFYGKSIKLADLISNSIDIQKNDKDFAVVYMREKKKLLEVLNDGDACLFNRASKIVEDYYR